MTDQALAGYKVLDLTHHIAGPYCTKMLAGLGAEVIKVEKPGEGDPARGIGPFFRDDPHPEKSIHFMYLNTGKKSITLNLKTNKGKDILKELVKDTDILVENFAPRVMPSLGLDYESLAKINPKLIMTSISNFGQTGPFRDYKALDINFMAMCGAMNGTGDPSREPLTYGGWPAQNWGGTNAFTASLIALYYREVSGEGQYIDISIQECMGPLAEMTDTRYQFAGLPNPRFGNSMYGFPLGGPRHCKDGYAVCFIVSPIEWMAFAKLIEMPEFEDAKYLPTTERLAHRVDIETKLAPWLMEHTMDEIFHKGQALGAPTNPSPSAKWIVESDLQMQARSYWTEVDHPVVGRFKYPGGMAKMTETPFEFGPAPLLGQHNEEILCRLGYPKEDLAMLRSMGAI